jgi:hypothetical protein
MPNSVMYYPYLQLERRIPAAAAPEAEINDAGFLWEARQFSHHSIFDQRTRRRFRPFFRPREDAHNSAGCTASKAHQPWSEKQTCFVATGRKVQKEMSERAIKKPAS